MLVCTNYKRTVIPYKSAFLIHFQFGLWVMFFYVVKCLVECGDFRDLFVVTVELIYDYPFHAENTVIVLHFSPSRRVRLRGG